MAKKISQFTEATEIKNDDISVVVQDGETKQFPLNLLATKAQADEYKTGVETQLADYEQEITNIKNQYDKELYTPTITVTNTSMIKTGQGDTVDYSASVEDGVVKSAILSGRTLVNLSITSDTTLSNGKELTMFNSMYKNNTLYTFIITTDKECEITYQFFNVNTAIVGHPITLAKGINKHTFTSPPTEFTRCILRNRSTDDVTFSNIMVIEGDYTNQDIPYFEGMQSVQMPGLTTIGKNLFDESQAPEQLNWGNNVKKANVKENTTYVYSSSPYTDFVSIKFYDNNDNEIGQGISINSGTSFTTPYNTSYLKTHTDNDSLVQIEEGTAATPYEPYKTNILSTPSDLELRGIGDVKDELDCLTGEVTECIKEVVLNGSENWARNRQHTDGSYRHICNTYTDAKASSDNVLCDKMSFVKVNGITGEGMTSDIHITYTTTTGKVQIATTKALSELKTWLAQNPLTVQYELATPTIKTVVLSPSGTLASEKPYMWKNGSIQLSSDGLVPNLDYAVTTSRVGVIETNMQETIQNEKRIHSLEVMLAQSTIAAATDAVSLQSDLETTTITVDGAQLDTGNTQDDFLYEMILLLIEKDAYDETLFDKVCAFYLYGKLSDEQFTNIYSLLYPEYPEEE